jgi:hypothetical protein
MQTETNVVEAVIPELERKLTTCDDIKRYIFAGNATFTIRSVETQKRFTYKIISIGLQNGKHSDFKVGTPQRKKLEEASAHKFWVKLLVGPDNEHSFAYIGMINTKQKPQFFTTRGSFASVTPREQTELQPSVRALDFVMRWLFTQLFMTPKIEIWHSGRCGRCGKKLTVPESIERGIGPDCAGKL